MTDQSLPADQPLAADLATPPAHLFVSPHYDDIALSCGGTVTLLTGAGRPAEIAVVFGDEPDPAAPLSPFAEAMHRDWNLDVGEVIASRRQEEAAAAAILGTPSKVLPFRDAIYRDRHYLSDAQLFGEVALDERALADDVAAALRERLASDAASARVYCPLGVGRHVDHQHGFDAGAALARAGWDVWFYEDLPYAINPDALGARLETLAEERPVAVAATIDVRAVWETKLAAILAYPSQLATVFGYVGSGSTPAAIDATMRRYAEGVGDGIASERFWRLA